MKFPTTHYSSNIGTKMLSIFCLFAIGAGMVAADSSNYLVFAAVRALFVFFSATHRRTTTWPYLS